MKRALIGRISTATVSLRKHHKDVSFLRCGSYRSKPQLALAIVLVGQDNNGPVKQAFNLGDRNSMFLALLAVAGIPIKSRKIHVQSLEGQSVRCIGICQYEFHHLVLGLANTESRNFLACRRHAPVYGHRQIVRWHSELRNEANSPSSPMRCPFGPRNAVCNRRHCLSRSNTRASRCVPGDPAPWRKPARRISQF